MFIEAQCGTTGSTGCRSDGARDGERRGEVERGGRVGEREGREGGERRGREGEREGGEQLEGEREGREGKRGRE